MTESPNSFQALLEHTLAQEEFASRASFTSQTLRHMTIDNPAVGRAVKDYLAYWGKQANGLTALPHNTEHSIYFFDYPADKLERMVDARDFPPYLRLHLLSQRLQRALSIPIALVYEQDDRTGEEGYFLKCAQGAEAKKLRDAVVAMLEAGDQPTQGIRQLGVIPSGKDTLLSERLPLEYRPLVAIDSAAVQWMNALPKAAFRASIKTASDTGRGGATR